MLIHGVGIGPDSMDELADLLSERHEVAVAHRPGYGLARDDRRPATVDEHVDDLVETVDRTGFDRPALVGVSGGATIVLAAAIRESDGVGAVVAHEPLAGMLCPGLDEAVRASAAKLAGDGDVEGFIERLVGTDTWRRLPASTRRSVSEHGDVIRGEAPGFASYQPHDPGPSGMRGVLVTVGGDSPEVRHRAARDLAEYGAGVTVVPHCGHLPQVQSPRRLAAVVLDAIGSPA